MAQNISSIVHFQDLHIMISFIKKFRHFWQIISAEFLILWYHYYANSENELIRIIKKMFVIIKEKNSFLRAMNIFFISSKKVRVSPQKQNKVENIQGIFLASYFFFLYIKSQQMQFLFWKKYNFENVQIFWPFL